MEDYNIIEAYVNNDMSREERDAFETRLETDISLQNELTVYKDMIGGIRAVGLRQQMAELKQKHEKSDDAQSGRIISFSTIRTLAVAASVALLVGFFFFNQPSESDPFSSVFFQDPGLPTVMGSEAGDLLTAMVIYKNGDYTEAIPKFKSLCLEVKSDEACYYLANSYLNLEDFEAAKTQFLQNMRADMDAKWLQSSQWYLSYCLYQLEDQSYKSVLQGIANNPNHKFNAEAVSVLDNLSN